MSRARCDQRVELGRADLEVVAQRPVALVHQRAGRRASRRPPAPPPPRACAHSPSPRGARAGEAAVPAPPRRPPPSPASPGPARRRPARAPPRRTPHGARRIRRRPAHGGRCCWRSAATPTDRRTAPAASVCVSAVDQQRPRLVTQHRDELVHDPARDPRVVVLRLPAEARLLGRVQPGAERGLQQRRGRDLERGAARQPAAQRHVRDHQRVERRRDQAARPEAGDDAARVVRPARLAGDGRGGQRNVDRFVDRGAVQAQAQARVGRRRAPPRSPCGDRSPSGAPGRRCSRCARR